MFTAFQKHKIYTHSHLNIALEFRLQGLALGLQRCLPDIPEDITDTHILLFYFKHAIADV